MGILTTELRCVCLILFLPQTAYNNIREEWIKSHGTRLIKASTKEEAVGYLRNKKFENNNMYFRTVITFHSDMTKKQLYDTVPIFPHARLKVDRSGACVPFTLVLPYLFTTPLQKSGSPKFINILEWK